MQQPLNCAIGKELAEHMVKGLVDRFLEYGYLSLIKRWSREDKAFYTWVTPTHEETVKVHVMPTCFTIYRDGFEGTADAYEVTISLDMNFNVTTVEIKSESHAFLTVATDLHRVLTSTMNSIDSFGKPKNPQQQIDCSC
jgi:hypothetical protein